MKRIIAAIMAFLCLCLPAFAHPGRTDSKGGHTDHSTGNYHYHHGYSAHQHPDGECHEDDLWPLFVSIGVFALPAAIIMFKNSSWPAAIKAALPKFKSVLRKVMRAAAILVLCAACVFLLIIITDTFDITLPKITFGIIILLLVALGICSAILYALYHIIVGFLAFMRDNKWVIPFIVFFILCTVVGVYLLGLNPKI